MAQALPTLSAAAAELGDWLTDAALPLWSTAGVDDRRGSFQEALTVLGEPWPAPRRSRVQTRQTWVYATAAEAGLGTGYAALAERAWGFHAARYLRPDGLFARAADAEGRITDPTPALYEQAFALLALAALHRIRPGGPYAAQAERLGAALEGLRHPAGGWREAGAQPFQANAHMHLLEAALAWEQVGEGRWAAVSDRVAELALARFVDPRSGVLREFFDAAWRPLADAAGQLIEPGHQFEWAWLLDQWGGLRGRGDARALARRLYATGLRGVDPAAEVVVNALGPDLAIRDAATRVWAQTEFLKAALIFGDEAQALSAARGLLRYLQTPRRGTWRDKLTADRAVVEEPSPATSFYHLVGAILPLMGRL